MEEDHIQIPEFARNDDKLFRHDLSDWQNNACLNYLHEKLGPYADGYKEGADAIVNTCIDTGGSGRLDTLIYPAVFLYRHYLELRLKEVIKGLRYCNNETASYPQHHSIDRLWNEFKDLYFPLTNEEPNSDFENTERLILEFADIDKASMTFRYPEDKKGNIGYKNNINIRNLGEVMGRVAVLLDAISWQVSDMVDTASDIRQSMR